MDAATALLLQEIVRKEGRSLLQYVNESFPWTTAKNQHVLPVLSEMAAEERDAATQVVRLLLKNRVKPPYLGAYPMTFTNINYMSVEFLLPHLTGYQNHRIAELDREILNVTDAEVKHLLHTVLEMKRRHLMALKNLGQEQPPVAASL